MNAHQLLIDVGGQGHRLAGADGSTLLSLAAEAGHAALIPLLVAAINELSADNATLKARLAALEAKP